MKLLIFQILLLALPFNNLKAQIKTVKDFNIDSNYIYLKITTLTYNGSTNTLKPQTISESHFKNGLLIKQKTITENPTFEKEITYSFKNSVLLSELQKIKSDFGYTENIINYAYDSIKATITIKKGIDNAPKFITQKKHFEFNNQLTSIDNYDEYDGYINLKEELLPNFKKNSYLNFTGSIDSTRIYFYVNNLLLKSIKPLKIGATKSYNYQRFFYDSHNNLEKIDAYILQNNKQLSKKTQIEIIANYKNYLVKNKWVIQIDQNQPIKNNGIQIIVRELIDDKNVSYSVTDEKQILEFCKNTFTNIKNKK